MLCGRVELRKKTIIMVMVKAVEFIKGSVIVMIIISQSAGKRKMMKIKQVAMNQSRLIMSEEAFGVYF
jgi:hypothetical protein